MTFSSDLRGYMAHPKGFEHKPKILILMDFLIHTCAKLCSMLCSKSRVTQWEKSARTPNFGQRALIEKFTGLTRDIWRK